ncbi:MAG: HisA/HisF-related TIM barrel protein [Thermoplasmata archaeon]
MGPSDPKSSASADVPDGRPVLIPNLYLDSGQIVEAESGQFQPVLDDAGKPADPFEVSDRLVAKFQRFCVVDLEGLRRNRPQLDYLQELSRSGELWVDAGVRTGDQVIDILVTGARRTVLSTAYLLNPKQLRRAWRLSTEILFAVETEGAVVRSRGNDWDNMPASEAVASARAVGIVDVVLRGRNAPVDWSLVRELASQGAVWVDGPSERMLKSRLTPSGAIGGFFDPPRSLLLGSEDVP